MSFRLNMGENIPQEIKTAKFSVPLDLHGQIIRIHTDNLNTVAQIIAETALNYENQYLLKRCLQNWQRKKETPLPFNALTALHDELQSHTKEATKYIYLDLLRILCGKNTLNMYGYIHFAAINLTRYYQSLTNRLLKALKQKEDEEAFIQALRLLVKVQIPQIKQAQVLWQADGAFEIYDERGRDLKKAYLDNNDSADWQSANSEDRLMSILLTFAPAKILLHDSGDHNHAPSLVQEVFRERLTIK